MNWQNQKKTLPAIEDHILRWLAGFGFVADPFGIREANDEPWLDRYFIRRPFYEQLLSNRKSTLIFAPRGGGKSATRLMIQSECRPAVPHAATLAVDFSDFSPFVEKSATVSSLSLDEYLPSILSQALKRLLEAASDLLRSESQITQADLSRLRYWIDKYAPDYLKAEYLPEFFKWRAPEAKRELIRQWTSLVPKGSHQLPNADKKVEALSDLWLRLKQTRPSKAPSHFKSPSQVMQSFVDFAIELLSLGRSQCETLYLLVDGIDEYDLTQNDPAASATVLRPLLANLHFLEIPNLTVKFFLPSEQRKALEGIARMDRLEVYALDWESSSESPSRDLMQKLLRRRIEAFNDRGMQRLDEMCAPELKHWIEDAMLEEGRDSPRSLLSLGHLVFIEHCRDLPEPESLIQKTEWERAVTRFRGSATSVVEIVSHLEPEHVATQIEPALPLLRIDLQARRVFRGAKEIKVTNREFRLLAYLYRRKEQICSRGELIVAVYEAESKSPADNKVEAISDEMINSLIYRLRKKIQPPGQKEPLYLQSVPGRGYCLTNVKSASVMEAS